MEIFGADLRGIDGELIRFRVLGETNSNGVHILGDARRVTARGTIERCLNAIHTISGFDKVGSQMRYTIDLTPVEAMVRSPGIDLPLAITILRATVQQSLEEMRKKIQEIEIKTKKSELEHRNSTDINKKRDIRQKLISQLTILKEQLTTAEQYQALLSGNNTEYLLIGKLDITTGAIESPRDGMLGMIAAVRPGMTLIVPEGAEVHAAIVAGGVKNVTALKARDISEVWAVVTGQAKGRQCRASQERIKSKPMASAKAPDLKDIFGNSRAKLALETALAGRHSLLLVGPAGHGKSMLALAATQLLPKLEPSELLEVNKIYSARGELSDNQLILSRPYQEVSNGVTDAALFGGGTSVRPGLISAAHRGVLFFDEVNLTPEARLDRLREPWSDGSIEIQHAGVNVTMPARFQFIGAMNPCKCAMHFHGTCSTCGRMLVVDQGCPDHPTARIHSACTCSSQDVRRYLGRLSQPIKDRIEIICLVSQYDQDTSWHDHHATRTVRTRIKAAWDRQLTRYSKFPGITCNSDLPHINMMFETGALTPETKIAFERELRGRVVSPRKLTQLLALARSVADLEDSSKVCQSHIHKTIAISGLDQGLLDGASGYRN